MYLSNAAAGDLVQLTYRASRDHVEQTNSTHLAPLLERAYLSGEWEKQVLAEVALYPDIESASPELRRAWAHLAKGQEVHITFFEVLPAPGQSEGERLTHLLYSIEAPLASDVQETQETLTARYPGRTVRPFDATAYMHDFA